MKLIIKREKLKQAIEKLKEIIEEEYEKIKDFPNQLKEICNNVTDINKDTIDQATKNIYNLKNKLYDHNFKDKWLQSNLIYPNDDDNPCRIIESVYGINMSIQELKTLSLNNNNGNVGIGTTSPANFFEIQDTMVKITIDLDQRLKDHFDLTQKAMEFKDEAENLRIKIHKKIDKLLERLLILTSILNNINGKDEYELTLNELIFFRL